MISITITVLSLHVSGVFGAGTDRFENQYFSINIPNSWTYIEYSSTLESAKTGYGPASEIWLTPKEFSDLLLINNIPDITDKLSDEGAFATFFQDNNYRIKNAPIESYVKYVIDKQGILSITSQQYAAIGKEKAVSIHANNLAGLDNIQIAMYDVMHDNQPYAIVYMANTKNFDKYLPAFEQMVKSFKFADDSTSEIENLSANENKTNTATNFSGANSTKFNNRESSNANGNSPEELYDECVRVAGKSFCDYLFRK